MRGRAAWKAILTDLHHYIGLNERDGAIWDMSKVEPRVERALALAYDPAGVDGLTSTQIESVLEALLLAKLSVQNIHLLAKSATGGSLSSLRDQIRGFSTAAAPALRAALKELGYPSPDLPLDRPAAASAGA